MTSLVQITVVSLANLHKRSEALARYYVTSYWQAEWVKKLRSKLDRNYKGFNFLFSRSLTFFLMPSLSQFRIRKFKFPSDLIRSVGPKCPLPFDKIIFPRTDHLYPAYKHDNQTPDRFGLVCATGMYRSAWHVDFPKFQTGIFVEWKTRKVFPEKGWPG